jgi:hypothetical protein
MFAGRQGFSFKQWSVLPSPDLKLWESNYIKFCKIASRIKAVGGIPAAKRDYRFLIEGRGIWMRDPGSAAT